MKSVSLYIHGTFVGCDGVFIRSFDVVVRRMCRRTGPCRDSPV